MKTPKEQIKELEYIIRIMDRLQGLEFIDTFELEAQKTTKKLLRTEIKRLEKKDRE